MVTIYDIARETGFSPPTVSKALNNTGKLSQATRQTILLKAKEMGYTPNITAQTLSTKRSHLIGVIHNDQFMQKGFSHPLFSTILNSFKQASSDEGYDLLFLTQKIGKKETTWLEHAKYRNVDAILHLSDDLTDEDEKLLPLLKIPFVSVNDYFEGASTVVTANEESALIVTEYLIKQGHKKIIYIGAPGSKSSKASEERLAGYKTALTNANIVFNPEMVINAEYWHANGGYNAMEEILDKKLNFTAIVAANDAIAFGVIKKAKEVGLSVPEDFSIIGFDGDILGEISTPAITTMVQNTNLIGQTALKLVIDKINGEESPTLIRVPAEFSIRESVKEI